MSPRQLLQIVGSKFPSGYQQRLERFSYGAGAFKVDYTLSSPIPWTFVRFSVPSLFISEGTLPSSERYFPLADAPLVWVVHPSLLDRTSTPRRSTCSMGFLPSS